MMLVWASPAPEGLYMIHTNMATNIQAVNMKVPEETTSPTKIVSALFHRRRALLFSAQREKLLNGKRFFVGGTQSKRRSNMFAIFSQALP